MNRLLTTLPTVLFFLSALLLHPGSGRAIEPRNYLLATANPAGTYYPVGVALATLTKIKLQPVEQLSLSAISSAGSFENLEKLKSGDVQFAILQGLYGYWAWNGIGPCAVDGKHTNLRSITMLWQNVEHFVLKSDFVSTGTIEDLTNSRDLTISLGERGSGSAGSGRFILESLGLLKNTNNKLVNLNYTDSASGMVNNTIHLMNTPAGPPVSAVSQVFSSLGKDVTILEFTPDQLNRINSLHPLWSSYTIVPGTYPGLDREVNTISQPNFLVVNKDVSDEDVYLILKTIYNNLLFLQNIHPITSAMHISKAIDGLPIPLHPGAARYYREKGITIPDSLITR